MVWSNGHNGLGLNANVRRPTTQRFAELYQVADEANQLNGPKIKRGL
jgi:hypothetical protein